MIGIVFAAMALVGCGEIPTPKFRKGDRVSIIHNGALAVVLESNPFEPTVRVRYADKQGELHEDLLDEVELEKVAEMPKFEETVK